MQNPATARDLVARGYSGAFSEDVQETRLDEAWRALRREVPTLEASLTAGTLDRLDVVDVVCAATMRVLRNPEGVEEESGALDDYRESWKRADSSQDLYFTAAELRRLTPIAATLGGFAGSVRYL